MNGCKVTRGWLKRTVVRTICVLLGAAIWPLQLSSRGEAIPTVSLEPAMVWVSPGEQFDIQVMINADADTMSNYHVVVRFDPLILEFITATEGELYTDLTPGFWTWFGSEEESLGTWEVFDIVFPSGSFVLAPGELVCLSFLAAAEGCSHIEFLSATVTDIERYPLDPLAREDARVCVMVVEAVDPMSAGDHPWDLGLPFPNPSRGTSTIRLSGPVQGEEGGADLAVYDVRGRRIRTLACDCWGSLVVWDGLGDCGTEVPSGVYFFRLEVGGKTLSRRVVILR
jgi:hypothetical protein